MLYRPIDCHFQIQLKKSSNYEVELENDYLRSDENYIEASKKCADITVQTKSEAGVNKYKAHRLLLAKASPVWSSMLSFKSREILKLTNLDSIVFQEIWQFICDGEISGESLKIHMKSLLNAARNVTKIQVLNLPIVLTF